ncbi:hypothetical protein Tph_c27620 [Thermacetogenium phaeum DSM 12270]|jgi:nickel-dependent lactate racemase|uniref:Uncharacterized protein n=1 Tax=Thermacetogenium phaeum (strain ATCC BAA-254 / DSM 26808 / PB) TaxID=1089553 RepID=K4LLF6_THEPS|nr:nickel-dependent lactate racemase [Thermacetogenium phaeum]AFV12927.1 hypothetical protein Tph_c27620 [Thermacetogenium phaeum DSM 12270]
MKGLKYGRTTLPLPPALLERAQWLAPAGEPEPVPDPAAAVRAALRNPHGASPLRELAAPGEKVAIIVSDITRPVPTYLILPPLLAELHGAGVRVEDVTIVFGLGTHRSMTAEERRSILGEEVFEKYRSVEPHDYVLLGRTSRGTPIEVTPEVAEADLVVLTGNLEYHYYAGYTGGFKALLPGVASYRAIENNHQMMMDPASGTAVADGNPVREDMEEFGRFFPRTFVVDVLLNSQKGIFAVMAGDPVAAHREGCRLLDNYYKVFVDAPADVVVVSAGGYPKDLNLYQAQKALESAARVVKTGGRLVLVAELQDGIGNNVFEEWMLNSSSPEQILERMRQGFVFGGHKAVSIAKLVSRCQLLLKSSLDDETARRFYFQPLKDLADLELRPGESVLIIPFGSTILPEVRVQ